MTVINQPHTDSERGSPSLSNQHVQGRKELKILKTSIFVVEFAPALLGADVFKCPVSLPRNGRVIPVSSVSSVSSVS